MSLFTSAIANVFSGQKAAKAQEKAAREAQTLSKAQYAETRSDFAPERAAGTTALSRLSDAYGFNGEAGRNAATADFRADPGYQYAIDQGTEQVQGSAAARGMLQSGGTLKAIQDRGMNLADQGYSNYLSRLRDTVGVGTQAKTAGAGFGAQAAGQQGQYATDAGTAKATGIIQPALGYNNFLNQILKLGGNAAGGGAGAYG